MINIYLQYLSCSKSSAKLSVVWQYIYMNMENNGTAFKAFSQGNI